MPVSVSPFPLCEIYSTMLLSQRQPATRRTRIFNSISFCALCAIFFLLYHVWSLDGKPTTLAPQPWLSGSSSSSSSSSRIPKKIWYKLGPKGLSNQTREWTDSCLADNPDYEHEFMTDLSGDAFVKTAFSSHPDLVESYLALRVPILKADLLRYLLLFHHGGIWSDLDVSCEGVPMDDWIPARYREDAGLVVGWEFDVGWGDNFQRQFTSWTIMAKPGLPHLWKVVEDILRGLRDKAAEHDTTIAGLTLEMVGDVVDFTGPRRFTYSVLESVRASNSLNNSNETVEISTISNLLEPKLVGDLLILPGYAFAASSNTYNEEQKAQGLGPALVTHHYAGTWKNENGGELV
jgi:alpha 1,6-mannosyltransferase